VSSAQLPDLAVARFCRVIPEIDIWRAANLMLKRYGEKALEESEAPPMSWQPPTITTA
jgi:hypothetical protein